MSRKRLLICLLLCFVPAGCSFFEARPDPTRYFALTSLPRTGQRAQDAADTNALGLGIGPIKFPGYLDRPQLVTRVSQNRFAVAENDRWAEPLEENFSRVLSQNLSILLQTDRIVAYPWVRSQQPTYQVQVEVLRLAAGGYSNREIAASLGTTEGTVKNQVSSVLSKLGVRDRTRAVLKGLELAII